MKKIKILVLVTNILVSIIGICSIGVALSSFFLFDSPGSENSTYVWVLFCAALFLPFACFGSVIASAGIIFKTKNYKKALLVFLLPVLVIAIMIASLVLIQIFCNGVFSC